MEITIKENGKITKEMDMEFISMQQESVMKENGKIIKGMDMEC